MMKWSDKTSLQMNSSGPAINAVQTTMGDLHAAVMVMRPPFLVLIAPLRDKLRDGRVDTNTPPII